MSDTAVLEGTFSRGCLRSSSVSGLMGNGAALRHHAVCMFRSATIIITRLVLVRVVLLV